MPDSDKVIKGLQCIIDGTVRCESCGYAIDKHGHHSCQQNCAADAIALLKEQEAVEPKNIPEELKQKMWNTLHAEEDKLEEKYVGTKEHNSWFLIYRPWLQAGFDLAIKAIADWEGR